MGRDGELHPRVTPERYLTEEVPAVGGVLKQRPEDFVVEELPLYAPSGDGEHVYLMIEKRNVTAMDMVGAVARHFRVPKHAVGYAGLKDKVAVTRQVVSVHMPGRDLASVPAFEHPRMSVLWVDRHVNKLRRGHLAGNRFSIRVRGVEPTRAVDALRVLKKLEAVGVPDRVGEQRFGFLMNNHLIGRSLFVRDYEGAAGLLLGPPTLVPMPAAQADARRLFVEKDFAGARRAMPPWLRTEKLVLEALAAGETAEQAMLSIEGGVLSYYFSAFQSAVFNVALDMRIKEGLLGELLPGDIAMAAGSRKMFDVDEVVLAEPDTRARLDAVEIGAAGPMWGSAMRRASGRPEEMDVAALAAFGVRPADLAGASEIDAEMTRGDRRPYRVPLKNVEVEGGTDEFGAYVRCAFDLPRGAFATTVMAEVMKPPRGGSMTAVDDEEVSG